VNIVTKFIAGITLVIIAVVGFIYSGVFNVSTQWEDPALLKWVLVETREASVSARAEDIQSPPLGSATQIANGFRSYREMCAVCHTPPGASDSPITQGLNPTPPDLTIQPDHAMSDAELFWVIKNGIRMTGMPAWGPSHDDAEIWDIVAFLKALPSIDAAEYQRLNTQTAAGHHSKVSAGHGATETKVNTHAEPKAVHSNTHENVEQTTGSHHLDVAPIEYIDKATHAH